MNSLYISLASAIVYFIISFIDGKFISKNNKSIKQLIKDCAIVFSSVYLGIMLLNKLIGGGILGTSKNHTPAFVGDPEF